MHGERRVTHGRWRRAGIEESGAPIAYGTRREKKTLSGAEELIASK
jgi:hypothetical protein